MLSSPSRQPLSPLTLHAFPFAGCKPAPCSLPLLLPFSSFGMSILRADRPVRPALGVKNVRARARESRSHYFKLIVLDSVYRRSYRVNNREFTSKLGIVNGAICKMYTQAVLQSCCLYKCYCYFLTTARLRGSRTILRAMIGEKCCNMYGDVISAIY